MATATRNVRTNERPGTRAQVRYARMSASKARVVLNLIRGKHVAEATEILTFSERLAAQVIDKCLRSAVANAVHNDEIPTEELYISACYADEGPTLKRFRPRARGRAGRIHKQTCHITLVVSRYTEEELDEQRRRADLRGESSTRSADASADRARRVARSRAADESADETPPATDEATDTPTATEVAEDTAKAESVDTPAATEVAEDTAATETADTPAATEVAEETATAETPEDTVDEASADATSSDKAQGAAGASDSGAAEDEETK